MTLRWPCYRYSTFLVFYISSWEPYPSMIILWRNSYGGIEMVFEVQYTPFCHFSKMPYAWWPWDDLEAKVKVKVIFWKFYHGLLVCLYLVGGVFCTYCIYFVATGMSENHEKCKVQTVILVTRESKFQMAVAMATAVREQKYFIFDHNPIRPTHTQNIRVGQLLTVAKKFLLEP